MKAKDIQKLTVKELKEKLSEMQTVLIKERAQAARGTQSKNPMMIKNTRKAIAKIMQSLATKKDVEAVNKA